MRVPSNGNGKNQDQEIERNTIKLNYNDICIDEPSCHLSIADEPIIIQDQDDSPLKIVRASGRDLDNVYEAHKYGEDPYLRGKLRSRGNSRGFETISSKKSDSKNQKNSNRSNKDINPAQNSIMVNSK